MPRGRKPKGFLQLNLSDVEDQAAEQEVMNVWGTPSQSTASAAAPSNNHQKTTVDQLMQIFADAIDPVVIEIIAQNHNYNFETAYEDLVSLGTSDPVLPCENVTEIPPPQDIAPHSSVALQNSTPCEVVSSVQNVGRKLASDVLVAAPPAPDGLRSREPAAKPVAQSSRPRTTPLSKLQNVLQQNVKVLVLLRGLPGSGKSFLAERIRRWTSHTAHICSADEYFTRANGCYNFRPQELPQAHSFAKQKAVWAMQSNTQLVIIDNTNIQVWEMEPFVRLGVENNYHIFLLEPDTAWRFNVSALAKRNIHGVPGRTLENMLAKYDRLTVHELLRQLGYSQNPWQTLTAAAPAPTSQASKPSKNRRSSRKQCTSEWTRIPGKGAVVANSVTKMESGQETDGSFEVEDPVVEKFSTLSQASTPDGPPMVDVPSNLADLAPVSEPPVTQKPAYVCGPGDVELRAALGLLPASSSVSEHFPVSEPITGEPPVTQKPAYVCGPGDVELRAALGLLPASASERAPAEPVKSSTATSLDLWDGEGEDWEEKRGEKEEKPKASLEQRAPRIRKIQTSVETTNTVKNEEAQCEESTAAASAGDLQVSESEMRDADLPVAQGPAGPASEPSAADPQVSESEMRDADLPVAQGPAGPASEPSAADLQAAAPLPCKDLEEEISEEKGDESEETPKSRLVQQIRTEAQAPLEQAPNPEKPEITQPTQRLSMREAFVIIQRLKTDFHPVFMHMRIPLEYRLPRYAAFNEKVFIRLANNMGYLVMREREWVHCLGDWKVLCTDPVKVYPRCMGEDSEDEDSELETEEEGSTGTSEDEWDAMQRLVESFPEVNFHYLRHVFSECEHHAAWAANMLVTSTIVLDKLDNMDLLAEEQDAGSQQWSNVAEGSAESFLPTTDSERSVTTDEGGEMQSSFREDAISLMEKKYDAEIKIVPTERKITWVKRESDGVMMIRLPPPIDPKTGQPREVPQSEHVEMERRQTKTVHASDRNLPPWKKRVLKRKISANLAQKESARGVEQASVASAVVAAEAAVASAESAALAATAAGKERAALAARASAVSAAVTATAAVAQAVSAAGDHGAAIAAVMAGSEVAARAAKAARASRAANKAPVHNVEKKKQVEGHPKKVSIPFTKEFADQMIARFGKQPIMQIADEKEDFVTEVPGEIARSIHQLLMDKLQKRFALKEKKLQLQIEDDERIAKEMHDSDFSDSSQSDEGQNLKEIMEMEVALAAVQESRKNENPNDIATKLTRDLLGKQFPKIDPPALNALFEVNDCDYKKTVDAILETFGTDDTILTVMAPDAFARHETLLLEQARAEGAKVAAQARQKAPRVVASAPTKIGSDVLQVRQEALRRSGAFREEAQKQLKLRQEYFKKASAAYAAGSKGIAAYYSEMGQVHKHKMDEANNSAAAELFGSQMGKVLDLHYLYVKEALEALEMFLEHHLQGMARLNRTKITLEVITGRGTHSKEGLARIKPAITARLSSKNIRFSEESLGVLKVVLTRFKDAPQLAL